MDPSAPIVNPCINICRMDLQGRYCQGCGRTLLEIGRWTDLSDAQRADVIASLPGRLPHRQTLPMDTN